MIFKIIGPLVLVLMAYFHYFYEEGSITYEPGILIEKEPYQKKITYKEEFQYRDYLITSLADFEVEGRVLSKKNYYAGELADISTTDLALGWKEMSDESVLGRINVWQSNRWYHWRSEIMPLSRDKITENSANMHLIPMDDDIRDRLKSIPKGALVRIKGKLVTVRDKDGRTIAKSSTTRKDTGAGACEVILVQEFEVIRYFS